MANMGLIMFLVIGALAGWTAGKIMKGGGFGLIGNIVVGVVGAFIGGYVFGTLGIFPGSLVGSLVMAVIGAVDSKQLVRWEDVVEGGVVPTTRTSVARRRSTPKPARRRMRRAFRLPRPGLPAFGVGSV